MALSVGEVFSIEIDFRRSREVTAKCEPGLDYKNYWFLVADDNLAKWKLQRQTEAQIGVTYSHVTRQQFVDPLEEQPERCSVIES